MLTSYLNLPQEFYSHQSPTKINQLKWVFYNTAYAKQLNLKRYSIDFYAGNQLPTPLESIALAYSGHQFGYFVPLLGDGRALILGEFKSPDGNLFDIQLKGSGATPYSRQGDGRAPLSAVLREYLISEAMHGLEIPTTRSLAAVASDQQIYRNGKLIPAGVLTRVASSHLRIGTFQYAALINNRESLKQLLDYAISRHILDRKDKDLPVVSFFRYVVDRQAFLVAEWMGVGFIHGVMNTDNMAISGETLDYGPCAFMDEFDQHCVFSSIDANGRYAYGNQPAVAHWNLEQLFQTLLPLANGDERVVQELHAIAQSFPSQFNEYWLKKLKAKLGLKADNAETIVLINRFLQLMQEHQPDFTQTFRLLAECIDNPKAQLEFLKKFGNAIKMQEWLSQWLSFINHSDQELHQIKQHMNKTNPIYIPRNHLINEAIEQFIENNSRTLMDELLALVQQPFQEQPNTERFKELPTPAERCYETFCGT